MPVTYEITATVTTDLCEAFEIYMISRHIPELLATDAFSSATFCRSASGRYRIRYEAHDRVSLEKYLNCEAARLREHFAESFPEGIDVTREEWYVIGTFAASQVS